MTRQEQMAWTERELLWEAFMALRSVSPQTGEVADAIWNIQVHGPWDNPAKRNVQAGIIDSNGHTILPEPDPLPDIQAIAQRVWGEGPKP